jgi:alkylhydroperoxidase family enzyme
MTWIKTVPMAEASDELKQAMEAQQSLYPAEYAHPVASVDAEGEAAGIVASHTLIPAALHHAFATFGALMAQELPLTRRQHEMITTLVSATNRCHY